MGEADDYLADQSKKDEEEFLNKLKEGKSYDKVEKEYLEKSKKTRRIYEKKYSRDLKNQKEEPKKKKKEEEKKEFIVERLSLEITEKDKRRRIRALKWFKFKRRLVNFLRKRPFDFFRYIFFRLKIKKKNTSQKISDLKEKTKQKSTEIFKKVKEKTKQIFNKTKAIIKKVKGKLKKYLDIVKTKIKKFRSKKEDDKKDNKEDADKKDSTESKDTEKPEDNKESEEKPQTK